LWWKDKRTTCSCVLLSKYSFIYYKWYSTYFCRCVVVPLILMFPDAQSLNAAGQYIQSGLYQYIFLFFMTSSSSHRATNKLFINLFFKNRATKLLSSFRKKKKIHSFIWCTTAFLSIMKCSDAWTILGGGTVRICLRPIIMSYNCSGIGALMRSD
jgi:hypothetical protein